MYRSLKMASLLIFFFPPLPSESNSMAKSGNKTMNHTERHQVYFFDQAKLADHIKREPHVLKYF